MATFKVGQRVRVIRCDPPPPELAWCRSPDYTGREGTVVSSGGDRAYEETLTVPVLIDGAKGGARWFRPYELAPLTDPKAEQFIERIKKLAREPAPVAPEEMDRVMREDRVPR